MKIGRMSPNLEFIFLKIALALALIFIFSRLSFSDPPSPATINGFVFHTNGTGAENEIPVKIINDDINQVFYTKVYAPPIPQLAGAYSASIIGTAGDLIKVYSYNSTHYGYFESLLLSSTTEINVTLNISRPAEINLTIIYPENHALLNTSQEVNVTINLTALINDAVGCNVTLFISNETVLNFSQGSNSTNVLGDISYGNTIQTNFTVLTKQMGSTNISAIANCSSDSVSFLELNNKSVENITVKDDAPPELFIIAPGNNTIENTSRQVFFYFNISDSSVVKCDFNVNGSYNDSIDDAQKEVILNFTKNLELGNYLWNINCTDSYGNSKDSGLYNFTMNAHYPSIKLIEVDQDIVLNAGSTKRVFCNVSIEDLNGGSDIKNVSATFYHNGSLSEDVDNNNTHYTNSSCVYIGSIGNIADFECSFYPYYYAISGGWECNVSASDFGNLSDTNINTTLIDTLYAINVSLAVLDFGDLAPGHYSEEKVLEITNLGNQQVNVSVLGYGGSNPITGDGFALSCEHGDNVDISNQRYSLESGFFYDKNQLSSNLNQMNLTINKQNEPATPVTNATYWQLYLPLVERGVCEGTIRFFAGAS
ncbi:MAG TPA: hypothetical protein PLX15_01755 [Candidatus Woesearchaeota archaeon]|nr:hypothetical protein [Candidatus Woesearchaeota archaeon]